MVFANQVYCAGLGSFITGFFDKPYLIAYFEGIEIPIDQTISVEVDISSIRRQYPAEIFIPYDLGYFAMVRDIMFFHLATLLSGKVLQLSTY